MSSPARKVLHEKRNVAGTSGNDAADAASTKGGPPLPPRTAFTCFKDARTQELRVQGDTDLSYSRMATEWQSLTKQAQAEWDEVARDDKRRHVQEKNSFKGPYNVPKRRAKKHPLAPKRPMSAFLKFSQKRRAKVKAAHPSLTNTDISKILGEMWRTAQPELKEPYEREEKAERAEYKFKIAEFRSDQAKLDAASRTSHDSIHQRTRRPEGYATHNLQQLTPSSRSSDHSLEHSYQYFARSPMYNQYDPLPYRSYRAPSYDYSRASSSQPYHSAHAPNQASRNHASHFQVDPLLLEDDHARANGIDENRQPSGENGANYDASQHFHARFL